ncbi:MAG: OsmC family protein, partial [Spirochaetaceae bacterium]|nr:OsmC family protein [Spirochaetaceae bacterium]
MAFENSIDGHKFIVDAAEEFGGKNKGPKPKPLLLNSLAGCTGMDVVSILGKMKQKLSWFNVRVEGDLGDVHPKTYQTIRLTFQFKKSDNLD